LRGWLGYFALADCQQFLRDLMQWLRRRLRACLWVQCKRVRTRVRELRALHTPEWVVRITAFSRRGPWFMAGGPLNGILTIDYWRRAGLIDLPTRTCNFVNVCAPPGADPHAGWCGRTGAKRPLLPDLPCHVVTPCCWFT